MKNHNINEIEFIPNIQNISSYQGHLIVNLLNDIEDINKNLPIWSGTQDNFNTLTEVNFEKNLYFIN